MKYGIFSNNVLKIIACISMLIDHMGYILFPNVLILRLIGRIAFPIFAFLLAEGCFYTRNKLRHFLVLLGFATIMQVVLFAATKMTSFSIFVHFSIAVGICYLIDFIDDFIRNKKIILGIIFILLVLCILIGLIIVDNITDYFRANYGIYAILLPIILYVIRKYVKKYHLFVNIGAIILVLVFMNYFYAHAYYQLYGIIACLFILFYNGKKGIFNLKYLFYIFYPLHMVILYAISMFIGG